MSLAQGPQRSDVWSQALYHWAIALPEFECVQFQFWKGLYTLYDDIFCSKTL